MTKYIHFLNNISVIGKEKEGKKHRVARFFVTKLMFLVNQAELHFYACVSEEKRGYYVNRLHFYYSLH